jgi:hypothetical protein
MVSRTDAELREAPALRLFAGDHAWVPRVGCLLDDVPIQTPFSGGNAPPGSRAAPMNRRLIRNQILP